MGVYAKRYIGSSQLPGCEGILGDLLGKIFKTQSDFENPDIQLWKRAKLAKDAIEKATYSGELKFDASDLIINYDPASLDKWLSDGRVIGKWCEKVLGQSEKLFDLLFDIEQGIVTSQERESAIVKVFKSIKLPPRPFKEGTSFSCGLSVTGISDKAPHCHIAMPKFKVDSISLTDKALKTCCDQISEIAALFTTGDDGYSANGQHQKILDYTDTSKMILRLKNTNFKPDDERLVRDTLTSLLRELGIACQLDNAVGAQLEESVCKFLVSAAKTVRDNHVQ